MVHCMNKSRPSAVQADPDTLQARSGFRVERDVLIDALAVLHPGLGDRRYEILRPSSRGDLRVLSGQAAGQVAAQTIAANTQLDPHDVAAALMKMPANTTVTFQPREAHRYNAPLYVRRVA